MDTRTKIRIDDCPEMRKELETLYEQATQVVLARWALELAKHVFLLAGFDWSGCSEVKDGFAMSEEWQRGEARVYDVRQAGFAVHRLAKGCVNEILRTALRTGGQAVATGHMREHAMVASDYAVRTINLLHPGDLTAVTAERGWQIQTLRLCLANS
ncbi:MAG: hypothetical protein NTX94_05880 [Caldiserica bacterium]|nr:hypothetical protein [Caldisericota bacterium]